MAAASEQGESAVKWVASCECDIGESKCHWGKGSKESEGGGAESEMRMRRRERGRERGRYTLGGAR